MENQTSKETQEETPTEPVETETQPETPTETSEETVKKDTSKTSETVDYENKFKESQKEAIRLKKENDDLRKEPKASNPASTETNIDAILEVQQATKELNPEEVAELKVRATATGKSLTEARKDENFVLWQKAYKEKVEKENIPESSTKQGESETEKPVSKMTLDEKSDYYAKQGFVKPFPKARPL